MLKYIEKLVSIPSFTNNFDAIGECFRICKEMVLDNTFIFEKNINNYKSILFSNCNSLNLDVLSVCHVDVYKSGKYEMTEATDKIFGRGVFDMKSFVVSNLTNLNRIIETENKVKYGVLVTSDEEIGGENGAKFWANNRDLKAKIILDSDSGYSLSTVIETNLGAITIKLLGNKQNVNKTMETIKKEFSGFYCEDFGDEIDMNFDDFDIINHLNSCMSDNVKFKVFMFNSCTKNDINDRYHKLYNKIAKNNGINIQYKVISATNDSRYFAERGVNIISNQATGGNNHKDGEWLDKNSFFIFNKIQYEFLESFND